MRKREAEQDLSPVSSLGEVAEKARFAPLHELLEPVKDTPVTELSVGLRAKLEKKAGEQLELREVAYYHGMGFVVLFWRPSKVTHAAEEHVEPTLEYGNIALLN